MFPIKMVIRAWMKFLQLRLFAVNISMIGKIRRSLHWDNSFIYECIYN